MGYVLNGKYHKGKPPSKIHTKQQSGFKQWDHQRQRKDFAREIIQPYLNGKPNQDFIDAWPDEAREYGFIPNSKDLL